MLTGELANKTKNQFYIIELSFFDEQDYRLKGKIESIFWDGSSWGLCTNLAHGLPNGCGFGSFNSVRATQLAREIKSTICNSKDPYMTWDELKINIESLNYLMPQEIKNLHSKLKDIAVDVIPNDGSWFPHQLWVKQ